MYNVADKLKRNNFKDIETQPKLRNRLLDKKEYLRTSKLDIILESNIIFKDYLYLLSCIL